MKLVVLRERLEKASDELRTVIEVMDLQRARLNEEELRSLFEHIASAGAVRWCLLAVRLRTGDFDRLGDLYQQSRTWIPVVQRAHAHRLETAGTGRDVALLAELAQATVLNAAIDAMRRSDGRRWVQQAIETLGAGSNRRLVRLERANRRRDLNANASIVPTGKAS